MSMPDRPRGNLARATSPGGSTTYFSHGSNSSGWGASLARAYETSSPRAVSRTANTSTSSRPAPSSSQYTWDSGSSDVVPLSQGTTTTTRRTVSGASPLDARSWGSSSTTNTTTTSSSTSSGGNINNNWVWDDQVSRQSRPVRTTTSSTTTTTATRPVSKPVTVSKTVSNNTSTVRSTSTVGSKSASSSASGEKVSLLDPRAWGLRLGNKKSTTTTTTTTTKAAPATPESAGQSSAPQQYTSPLNYMRSDRPDDFDTEFHSIFKQQRHAEHRNQLRSEGLWREPDLSKDLDWATLQVSSMPVHLPVSPGETGTAALSASSGSEFGSPGSAKRSPAGDAAAVSALPGSSSQPEQEQPGERSLPHDPHSVMDSAISQIHAAKEERIQHQQERRRNMVLKEVLAAPVKSERDQLLDAVKEAPLIRKEAQARSTIPKVLGALQEEVGARKVRQARDRQQRVLAEVIQSPNQRRRKSLLLAEIPAQKGIRTAQRSARQKQGVLAAISSGQARQQAAQTRQKRLHRDILGEVTEAVPNRQQRQQRARMDQLVHNFPREQQQLRQRKLVANFDKECHEAHQRKVLKGLSGAKAQRDTAKARTNFQRVVGKVRDGVQQRRQRRTKEQKKTVLTEIRTGRGRHVSGVMKQPKMATSELLAQVRSQARVKAEQETKKLRKQVLQDLPKASGNSQYELVNTGKAESSNTGAASSQSPLDPRSWKGEGNNVSSLTSFMTNNSTSSTTTSNNKSNNKTSAARAGGKKKKKNRRRSKFRR